MSLIKCPECGGEVSTSAPHCVHCGCKITVCPDCGHVAVDVISTCPECGCVISTDKKDVATSVATPAPTQQKASSDGIDIEELRTRWLESSALDSLLFTKRKILLKIIEIIGFGLLVLAGILIVMLCNGTDIEKLTDFQSTLSSVKALSIAGAIILIVSCSGDDLCSLILVLRLSKILERSNIDIVACLKRMTETTTTEDSKLSAFTELFIKAAYFNKGNGGKIKTALQELSVVIGTVVLIAGGLMFILNNAAPFMAEKCFDIPFELDYSGLIVAGVGFGLILIFAAISVFVFDEMRTKWARKFANIG